MEVLGEPCASFREIKAITSNLTVFTLYYLNYFILGYFWPKTGVGQTSPEWIQTDPDESSQYQLVLCDITDITEGAKM